MSASVLVAYAVMCSRALYPSILRLEASRTRELMMSLLAVAWRFEVFVVVAVLARLQENLFVVAYTCETYLGGD